jgi:hypothetical protein
MANQECMCACLLARRRGWPTLARPLAPPWRIDGACLAGRSAEAVPEMDPSARHRPLKQSATGRAPSAQTAQRISAIIITLPPGARDAAAAAAAATAAVATPGRRKWAERVRDTSQSGPRPSFEQTLDRPGGGGSGSGPKKLAAKLARVRWESDRSSRAPLARVVSLNVRA